MLNNSVFTSEKDLMTWKGYVVSFHFSLNELYHKSMISYSAVMWSCVKCRTSSANLREFHQTSNRSALSKIQCQSYLSKQFIKRILLLNCVVSVSSDPRYFWKGEKVMGTFLLILKIVEIFCKKRKVRYSCPDQW